MGFELFSVVLSRVENVFFFFHDHGQLWSKKRSNVLSKWSIIVRSGGFMVFYGIFRCSEVFLSF